MTNAATPSCDCTLAVATPGGSTRHPGWTITATMLASSLAFIDGSVTNVALPSIAKDLDGGAAGLSWVINAYLLPLSALLLLGGAAGDQFGRKRTLIIGVVIFAAASVGCALAADLDVLLAARVLQGIGAAIREGGLEPGGAPSPGQVRKSRIVMAGITLFLAAMVFLGFRWWSTDEATYRRYVYKPLV